MLTRFFQVLRGRADGPAGELALAPNVLAIEGRETNGTFSPDTVPHDPVLPHPAAMTEQWRQQIARAALTLRTRSCTDPRDGESTAVAGAVAADDDARARVHAERLLLALTLDQNMIVRQPPPAAQEALAVAGDPDCELTRLVQIIERDPTLTRGLMRHASSAMFAIAGAPASIDDAARRLGAKGVQIAVLAGMAEGLLARGAGPYSPLAEAAWASMVRVGPLARSLARALAVPAHEAFLLGLLHDIGTLVLCDLLGALQVELGHPVALPATIVAEAVRELHEPLGALTLLRWGIDPRAAWAVAHHHRRAPADEPDRRSELLYLATRLDAARVANTAPTPERWCVEGQLTIAPERAAAAIARVRG